MAATQAYDLQSGEATRAARTAKLHAMVREHVPFYRDDRPLNGELATIRKLLGAVSVASESEA
jgi:histidine ammonia-lyase